MPTPHESHMAHAKRRGLAVPCTAYHVNYGGGCLNCGWLPATPPRIAPDARTPEDDQEASPPPSAQGASVERVCRCFVRPATVADRLKADRLMDTLPRTHWLAEDAVVEDYSDGSVWITCRLRLQDPT